MVEKHVASVGNEADDVVIAVGPAFADGLRTTIGGLAHQDVLEALIEGVREAGAAPRLVRVRRASDVAFIGHDGARLAGSGVAIGIQSKGTTRDPPSRPPAARQPRALRHGAARSRSTRTARSAATPAATRSKQRVGPVPTVMDNFARAKLIVRTTLLHARETAAITPGAPGG